MRCIVQKKVVSQLDCEKDKKNYQTTNKRFNDFEH